MNLGKILLILVLALINKAFTGNVRNNLAPLELNGDLRNNLGQMELNPEAENRWFDCKYLSTSTLNNIMNFELT